MAGQDNRFVINPRADESNFYELIPTGAHVPVYLVAGKCHPRRYRKAPLVVTGVPYSTLDPG